MEVDTQCVCTQQTTLAFAHPAAVFRLPIALLVDRIGEDRSRHVGYKDDYYTSYFGRDGLII